MQNCAGILLCALTTTPRAGDCVSESGQLSGKCIPLYRPLDPCTWVVLRDIRPANVTSLCTFTVINY